MNATEWTNLTKEQKENQEHLEPLPDVKLSDQSFLRNCNKFTNTAEKSRETKVQWNSINKRYQHISGYGTAMIIENKETVFLDTDESLLAYCYHSNHNKYIQIKVHTFVLCEDHIY